MAWNEYACECMVDYSEQNCDVWCDYPTMYDPLIPCTCTDMSVVAE